MQTMYPGKVNSPTTILDGGINDVINTINVINGSVLPVSPNIAVIGTEVDAETILYANRVGNVLSNITRGFQGVAKAWSSGETIARLFTEYDYASLKSNLGTLAGRKITDFAECNSTELRDKITDETGTGKAVFGTYPEITKIDLTEGQIKFPAVVNPSSDPNTQDDYEEGIHIVVATMSTSGTVTLPSNYNKLFYTKTGRLVSIVGEVHISSVNSPVGVFSFSLPFTTANIVGSSAGALIGTYSVNYGTGTYCFGFIPANIAYMRIKTGGDNIPYGNVIPAAGDQYYFGFLYITE